MKKIAVILISLVCVSAAYGDLEKGFLTKSVDFAAPVVGFKTSLADVPAGQIVYEQGTGFGGLTTNGGAGTTSNWVQIVSSLGGPRSEIQFNNYLGTGSNSVGSNNTSVVYFNGANTVNSNTATFTDNSSASNGTVVQINETGLYGATAALIGTNSTSNSLEMAIGLNLAGTDLTGTFPSNNSRIVCTTTAGNTVGGARFQPTCSRPFTITATPAKVYVWTSE